MMMMVVVVVVVEYTLTDEIEIHWHVAGTLSNQQTPPPEL